MKISKKLRNKIIIIIFILILIINCAGLAVMNWQIATIGAMIEVNASKTDDRRIINLDRREI